MKKERDKLEAKTVEDLSSALLYIGHRDEEACDKSGEVGVLHGDISKHQQEGKLALSKPCGQ